MNIYLKLPLVWENIVNPDKSFTFCSETSPELQRVSLISKILILTTIPFSKLESTSCGPVNKTLVKQSQTQIMDLGFKRKKESKSKAILKYNMVTGMGCICLNISLGITFTSRKYFRIMKHKGQK